MSEHDLGDSTTNSSIQPPLSDIGEEPANTQRTGVGKICLHMHQALRGDKMTIEQYNTLRDLQYTLNQPL
jgi:hypothetical protein